MTQLHLWEKQQEREALLRILHANTGPDTAARRLGEWLLQHGPATTGQIVEWGRQHMCSSVLERLRLNLRQRCGWPVKSKLIPGRKTHVYWISGLHQDPPPCLRVEEPRP